eukprot:jgi/Botrbrau1/2116/Bobra.0093s0023.1
MATTLRITVSTDITTSVDLDTRGSKRNPGSLIKQSECVPLENSREITFQPEICHDWHCPDPKARNSR